MEQDPKWVAYINIIIALVFKLGYGATLLAALYKGLDWIQGWAATKLEEAKAKVNEFKIMQMTQVDDQFFDILCDISYATFKNLKEDLKVSLEDGKITREEYVKLLHDDVIKNFKVSVPKAKQEMLSQAYDDLEAAIDVKLPGVIKHVKDLARAKLGSNGDVVEAAEAVNGGNS